jgi:hypothetical protein
MKMVKSLLLGSAAGLVAVTTGQAADLPVKAKPVEYVKICSLYGAGFYYMPGTDLCLKIGGWVRAEATYGPMNANMTWGEYAGDANQRSSGNLVFRARGYITADAREQTAYGTARGYIAVGLNTNDAGFQVNSLVDSANRAFVQWAGITAGLSQSFFDFFSVPAVEYRGGYLPASDTGDGGWWIWAYTAQLGSGFSATVSAESRRTTQIIYQNNSIGLSPAATNGTIPNGSGGTIVPGSYFNALTASCAAATGATPSTATCAVTPSGAASLLPGSGAYGGFQAPDVVANLRVDQTWGSAQIMGALHEVNATYYGSGAVNGAPAVNDGHPSDSWGFAVGAGLRINAPFVAQGDYFQSQVNYTQGALRYLENGENTNFGALAGTQEVFGVSSDCVYGGSPLTGNATGCNLTTGWGVNASYEHYWTPQWHQSLYGAYYAFSYNSQANAMLCQIAGFGTGLGTLAAVNTADAGCNNNWQIWGVGSRLQWDVTKTFYLGVEGLYTNMQSATTGSPTNAIGGYTFGSATQQTGNLGAWAVTVRMHKDFLP